MSQLARTIPDNMWLAVRATTDQAANGDRLLAAIARAVAMTPRGATRSATNRVTIALAEGTYYVPSRIDRANNGIDIVGLGAAPYDVKITSDDADGTILHRSHSNYSNLTIENTYETFSEAVHIVETFDISRIRRFVAGVDWGFTNPGVISVYAVDGDMRKTLIEEVYRTRRLIEWWTDQAVALRDKYSIEAFYCDPAEPAYIEQFRQAGVPAVEGFNSIIPGINTVKEHLAIADDGRPRLQFLRTACKEIDPALEDAKLPVSTLEEITAYAYPKAPDGKPVKELPVDMYNHGMDAMRYAVTGADNTPWLLW